MPKRILYLGLDPIHHVGEGEIVHWPIIRIVPRPLCDPTVQQALQSFEHYSHIILTSKSSVAILRDYLPQLGFGLQSWEKKITLVVGQVTAKYLMAYGITPHSIAKEETAEGIIHEIQQLQFPLENAHFFWPHSAQARPLIKDFLMNQHMRHTTCVLYEPETNIPGNLPDLESFDEIIFTSPSTVNAFLKVFGTFPSGIQLTPIGPITASHLKT